MAQGRIEDGVPECANTKTLRLADGMRVVVYQCTGVVRWDSRKITLTAPGLSGRGQDGCNKTQTTKLRMNQAAYQHDLGYKVFQQAGKWFVQWGDAVIPFEGDSVKLYRNTPRFVN